MHGTFVDLFDLFERHRIGARCMRSAAPIVSVSSPRSLALIDPAPASVIATRAGCDLTTAGINHGVVVGAKNGLAGNA